MSRVFIICCEMDDTKHKWVYNRNGLFEGLIWIEPEFMDEATSALDTVTEAHIQAAFDTLSQGRTTLVIAHRLSTVRHADEIVYIDAEGIREKGTHEELMQQGGLYASLCAVQFQTSKDS